MAEPHESEQIEACRRGDRDAYRPLVERHYRRVLAVCSGILGCAREEAEDAAQETMIRGFQRIGSLRAGAQFAPWILRIARNVCLDALRRRKRSDRGLPPLLRPAPMDDERHEQLRRAVELLGPELRTPLLMYYYDGRSIRGVAEALGLSPTTICERLRQARIELHERLTDDGD